MNDTPICASVEQDLGISVDELTTPAPEPAYVERARRAEDAASEGA